MNSFNNCYSLRKIPDELDVSEATSAPMGTFKNLQNLTAYPRMLKANISFAFAESKNIADRTSFAVIENGVCADTSASPSAEYGICNNINVCTNADAQTVTVTETTKAMFTADEWAAIAACLSAKNWNLSPA